MQFTDNIGIQATKEELNAILAFSGDGEEHRVSFRVKDGDLLVWASHGANAIYHQGFSFDDEGAAKPFRGTLEWEIAVDIIETIHRMMESGDEVIFETDRKGKMSLFRVRDIESSEKKMEGSLDGKVSNQLTFDIRNIIPIDRPSVAFGTDRIAWYPSTVKLLDRVSKALGKGAIAQFRLPDNELGRTYIYLAERSVFIDGESPRWTIVLAAVDLVESFNRSTDKLLDRIERATKPNATLALPFESTPETKDPDEDDAVDRALRERAAVAKPKKKAVKPSKSPKTSAAKDKPVKDKPVKAKAKKSEAIKKPTSPALEDFEEEDSEDGDSEV